MAGIDILRPKTASPNQLIIDIVVKFPSAMYQIAQLRQDGGGIYHVPLTWRKGVDIHTSYEQSGEQHKKLTKGKLMVFPANQMQNIAEAHYKNKAHWKKQEVILWQRKGMPWGSLKGVERIAPHQKGVQCFVNVEALASGYPIWSGSSADYAFEIDANSLPSAMVGIVYFVVEPDNLAALEDVICETRYSWNRHETEITWRQREFMTVEKADLFTNLIPWFAIVLFSRRAESSESCLGGQKR